MFENLVTYHILRSDDLPAYDAIGYQYIMAGNGLFVRTQTRFFTAVIPVERALVRGLPLLEHSFHLRVPKLPEALLTAVIADARRARRPDGGLNESLYQFHHDGETVKLKKPPQQATAVSVTSSSNKAEEAIICDLHSHGNMKAFWSETDDMDERNGRLYAVIGKVDDPRPEIRLRVGIYGYWMSLSVTALFADSPQTADLQTAIAQLWEGLWANMNDEIARSRGEESHEENFGLPVMAVEELFPDPPTANGNGHHNGNGNGRHQNGHR